MTTLTVKSDKPILDERELIDFLVTGKPPWLHKVYSAGKYTATVDSSTYKPVKLFYSRTAKSVVCGMCATHSKTTTFKYFPVLKQDNGGEWDLTAQGKSLVSNTVRVPFRELGYIAQDTVNHLVSLLPDKL